jgi:hypothetical protein
MTGGVSVRDVDVSCSHTLQDNNGGGARRRTHWSNDESNRGFVMGFRKTNDKIVG